MADDLDVLLQTTNNETVSLERSSTVHCNNKKKWHMKYSVSELMIEVGRSIKAV